MPLPQNPQSVGQDPGVSPNVQMPSPHRVRPQSMGQDAVDSGGEHTPSPHRALPQSSGQKPRRVRSSPSQRWLPHVPKEQSFEQVNGSSPKSQVPLPQNGPQSFGHVLTSPPSQNPLPQVVKRQSEGHEKGVSNASHTRLPHTNLPQSWGQLIGLSPASQMKFPQNVGTPQSVRQLEGVSPGSQIPLPQNVIRQSTGQVAGLSPISQ